ncbi:MAG: hypothetical protein Q7R51_01385 [bacterium]|nr:hypothetical protein [bacterium]
MPNREIFTKYDTLCNGIAAGRVNGSDIGRIAPLTEPSQASVVIYRYGPQV